MTLPTGEKVLLWNIKVHNLNGNIDVDTLVQTIKEQGYDVSQTRMSYFCPIEQLYIHACNITGKVSISFSKRY